MSRTKTEDIRDLAGFGYRQELDRSLGSFSSFAAGFSYISILTGVFQMFYLGFAAAGPAFFWTWPVVFLGQFTVALGFAELAAHYPLSGGVYQWSRRIGSPALGWMTGWVYLASSLISLAAVALALQATLPQIAPVFQLIGDGANPGDRARNAVLLGCVLIGLTTVINAAGVRLMARINNVGVVHRAASGWCCSLSCCWRGPGAGRRSCFRSRPRAVPVPALPGWLSPLPGRRGDALVRHVRLRHGRHPRRGNQGSAAARALGHSPGISAAGVAGGLLIIAGLLAVRRSRPCPGSARSPAGCPRSSSEALGPELGNVFLGVVIFAVTVCALAVHAGTVRLDLRDGPGQQPAVRPVLAMVQHETRTPIVPAVVTGVRGGDDPACERESAADHRDPLLRGHRLGQPGVPDGDIPAPARADAGLAAESGCDRGTGRCRQWRTRGRSRWAGGASG